LAILAITLGVLSVVTGLAGVGLSLLIVEDYSSLAATILLSLGTVVFLFGIIEIFYGVGFLEQRGWSWTLGMIIALVSLFSSIVVIALPAIVGSRLTAAAGPADVIALGVLIIIAEIAIIPIITSSLTIYGLTRRNVKVFFGKGLPAPSLTKCIELFERAVSL
jgi:hypothetical protein